MYMQFIDSDQELYCHDCERAANAECVELNHRREMRGQDLVAKARVLVMELGQERKSALCKAVTHKVVERRAQETINALCDEVVRLREQWDTRISTLCGNCGKRYLGPRDDQLHGYGICNVPSLEC